MGFGEGVDSVKDILPSPIPKQFQERDNNMGSKILSRQSASMGLTNSNPFLNTTGTGDGFNESKNKTGSAWKDTLKSQDAQSLKTLSTYGIESGGFIASLNLSPIQMHDLFKVPQTFYYLIQKQSEDIANDIPDQFQSTNISKYESDHGSNASDKDQTYASASFDVRNYNASVYDLKIVPLDQIDKNHYFTISKEGITQFWNKASTFTSLSQWDREYKLYHKIANIQFFRLYKRWKVIRY